MHHLSSDERAAASKAAASRDAILVDRFKGGDERAFEEIIRNHRNKIFSIALSFTRNSSDAEEITQDTFIQAFRCLANFRSECSLSTWMHQIVMNHARNRYWYNRRRRRHLMNSIDVPIGDEGEETFADLLTYNGHNPAQVAIFNESARLLGVCLKRLEAKHQEVLKLRDTLQMSYKEIAKVAEIPIGTVKSRLKRARRSLRVRMAQKYAGRYAKEGDLTEILLHCDISDRI